MNSILYYKRPASVFEEALPIGNGKTGAMVYSQPEKEHISLNDDTLWSGRGEKNPIPENAPSVYRTVQKLVLEGKTEQAEKLLADGFFSEDCQSYMPLGDMYLNFGNERYENYCRKLDMNNGIVYSEYSSGGVSFKRESFVSFPDKVAVFFVSASENSALNFSFGISSKLKVSKICFEGEILSLYGAAPPDGRKKNKEKENYDYNGKEGMKFILSAKICTDGILKFDGDCVIVSNASKAVIYVVTETEYENIANGKNDDFCHEAVKRVSALQLNDFCAIRDRHIVDFSELFGKVSFSLIEEKKETDIYDRLKRFDGTDLGLYELLFSYGRYLAISSSRPGTQVTNLQGIWNEKLLPPWSCCIVLNINMQMNYWHMFNTNMAECFEPFIRFAEKLRENGRQTAVGYYGAGGFAVHHNTDIWGMTNPVGANVGEFAVRYTFWTVSTGWIACQLFSAYEYTADRAVLERIYPIIRDAALFFADTVCEDENGLIFVSPTTSPENTYIRNGRETAVSKTAAMSQSVLRELFENVLKASEILNIADSLTERVKQMLPRIKPISLNADGTLAEWSGNETESDAHHRHISHLYGLFPGNSISPELTPNLAEACRKTLEKRGDDGTGWSLAWKVSLWAYLKDGEHALRLLKRQLSLVEPTEEINYSDKGGTFPNMFDAHPPFQIDGNFGSTAAICNMLMQSRMGKIELLPALPALWKNGEISGIKAKGNITVSMRWKNGKVIFLSLATPNSQRVNIKFNGMEQTVNLLSDKSCELKF